MPIGVKLPKLTINGIDGFKTPGKWSIAGNAQVVDDETLVINSTATGQQCILDVPTRGGLSHYIGLDTLSNDGIFYVQYLDSGKTLISSGPTLFGTTISATFTTPNNCAYVRVLPSTRFSTGQALFKRLQLNLGSTPAPYSKKTGDKMVMPVPKKNLFDGVFESGYYDGSGSKAPNASAIRSVNLFPVKPNTDYILKSPDVDLANAPGGQDTWVRTFDNNKSYISLLSGRNTFKTPSNCYFIGFYTLATANLTTRVQLEEGTLATPYTPYAVQVNKRPAKYVNGALPKAKTGLSFNGTTDYLQLPSMTMDSIEIDCLIDSVQGTGTRNILDARTGLASSFLTDSGTFGAGITSTNGVVKGVRTKLKVNFVSSFTDDVIVFSDYLGAGAKCLKGTLYKVTCYLAGQVIAIYDFENPLNQVGSTMMDAQAVNLIPPFDYSRWSLHANTQVLGKDYLRLNATGAQQISEILLPVKPNTSYLLSSIIGLNADHRMRVRQDNLTGAILTTLTATGQTTFIVPSGVSVISLSLFNNSVAGTFDFIQPKLFQLDGKEGTINGSPTRLNKASKRSLISKR
jgi:hypothetical protein